MKKLVLLKIALFSVIAALTLSIIGNGTDSIGIDSPSFASSETHSNASSSAPSPAPANTLPQTEETQMLKLVITVGVAELIATFADNSSARALRELLSQEKMTIQMHDYGGFEKVGSLARNLPTNDEQISTAAGDLILYQGNSFVIYYATNSWSFTRLGRIDNVSADELKEVLGNSDVTVTLSVKEKTKVSENE